MHQEQKTEEIKKVGHNKFGFDSEMDVDTLRSLYLVSFASRNVGSARRAQSLSRVARSRCLDQPTGRLAGGAGRDGIDTKDNGRERWLLPRTRTVSRSQC